MSTKSTPNSASEDEKPSQYAEHIDTVESHDRVPGNSHYIEKDGLRTYGDDEDHDVEPKLSFKRFMSLTAMAFLWTGSQIPVYIFGLLLSSLQVSLE